MPIKARIDMLSTGIRTPIGVKVIGTDLAEIDKLARQIEQVLQGRARHLSAYAERGIGGYYLDIDAGPRRRWPATASWCSDVQETIATALGGETVTTTVEGRERYTVNVRYPRDLRDDPQAIASDVLVPMPAGGAVPLGEVATVAPARGPTIDPHRERPARDLHLCRHPRPRPRRLRRRRAARRAGQRPVSARLLRRCGAASSNICERATARLKIVVPVTLSIIFLLLYLNFRSLTETLIVMLSLPFALVGGALADVVARLQPVRRRRRRLHRARRRRRRDRRRDADLSRPGAGARSRRSAPARAAPLTRDDLYDAIMDGAVERVRPKMMTVVAIMAGLLPIMWSTGTGSEVMQRIAVPMIGGMVSSTLLTLIVIPAIYRPGQGLVAFAKERGCPSESRDAGRIMMIGPAGNRRAIRASLPRIPHHALAGVAGGDAGELALEGGGGGPAVQPFHFGGRRDEGSIVRLRRAVDDEGCARQRLERRTDDAVGVEVVRPGRASAQGEDAILHREGFVAAQAEFAARGRDALRAVGQRKGVGADDRLLGIGRQIEGGELSGGIGRTSRRSTGRQNDSRLRRGRTTHWR